MLDAGRPEEQLAERVLDPLEELPEVVFAEIGSVDPEHERWNHAVRTETPMQRIDRNYHELLQEVRVAQIGVQTLFAFLLSCAFSQRFDQLTPYQHLLYVSALLLTIVTASLFTAPAAYHRVLFRLRMKGHVVDVANRFAISGMVVLVFAMSTGLLLVLDMILGHLMAACFAVVVVAWFGCWWYAVPMARRMRHGGPGTSRGDR